MRVLGGLREVEMNVALCEKNDFGNEVSCFFMAPDLQFIYMIWPIAAGKLLSKNATVVAARTEEYCGVDMLFF